jgi:uncharacterized protein
MNKDLNNYSDEQHLTSSLSVRFLVLQPTPFCNLRCTYCYLSETERGNKIRMKPNVPADVLRYLSKSKIAAKQMKILWIAGEPLAVGIQFYREAVEQMDKALEKDHTIFHTIQTNATLINEEWCEFFKEKNFGVGVSIDGPQFLNDKHRIFSTRKGSFELIMRGIRLLKQYQVPFYPLAVISYDSLNYADEIYDFFESIEANRLALNIEEEQGINTSKTMRKGDCLEKYRKFLERLYERQKTGKVIVREIEEIQQAILGGDRIGTEMNNPFHIFAVDHTGNFSTFCPELLTTKHEKYGTFVLGNIYDTPIEKVLSSEKYIEICKEIQTGVDACKQTCEYFFLCGGGAPGNKLHENKSFASTETFYCKTKIKIPVQVVLPHLEEIVK